MYKDITPGTEINFVYIDANNKVSEQRCTLLSHKDYKFYGKCLNDGHLKAYLYESILQDLHNFNGDINKLIDHYQKDYKEYVPVRRGPRDPSRLNIRTNLKYSLLVSILYLR